MDCVLIFFQRKLPKVIKDTIKMFLEPNWKESLKVNLVLLPHNNCMININIIILFYFS